MKNEIIHKLCSSGAFGAFKDLCGQIEEPNIEFMGTDTNGTLNLAYKLGLRDGHRQFKQELFDLITKLASE